MSLFEIDYHPTRRQVRIFGIAVAAIVGWTGWWCVTHFAEWGWWLAVGLWLVSAATLARPATLRRVYIGLMVVTWPLGLVVSWIVLAVVFFGVFTPIGLVLRWLGRDPLALRFDRGAATYWTQRQPPQSRETYFRQF